MFLQAMLELTRVARVIQRRAPQVPQTRLASSETKQTSGGQVEVTAAKSMCQSEKGVPLPHSELCTLSNMHFWFQE